MMFKNFQEYN